MIAFAAFLFLASPDDDVTTLSTQLDQDVAALSTSDCTTACKALVSIKRAADRICALEPGGPRCDAARTKADDATRRVREACPDCAEAAMAQPAATAQVGPPAEAPRGGCRSCATAPALPDGGDVAALLLALAVISRRISPRGARGTSASPRRRPRSP